MASPNHRGLKLKADWSPLHMTKVAPAAPDKVSMLWSVKKSGGTCIMSSFCAGSGATAQWTTPQAQRLTTRSPSPIGSDDALAFGHNTKTSDADEECTTARTPRSSLNSPLVDRPVGAAATGAPPLGRRKHEALRGRLPSIGVELDAGMAKRWRVWLSHAGGTSQAAHELAPAAEDLLEPVEPVPAGPRRCRKALGQRRRESPGVNKGM
jgi:hypothetical protein